MLATIGSMSEHAAELLVTSVSRDVINAITVTMNHAGSTSNAVRASPMTSDKPET